MMQVKDLQAFCREHTLSQAVLIVPSGTGYQILSYGDRQDEKAQAASVADAVGRVFGSHTVREDYRDPIVGVKYSPAIYVEGERVCLATGEVGTITLVFPPTPATDGEVLYDLVLEGEPSLVKRAVRERDVAYPAD